MTWKDWGVFTVFASICIKHLNSYLVMSFQQSIYYGGCYFFTRRIFFYCYFLHWSIFFFFFFLLKFTGVGTPIRRGLGGISLLKWSPTGDYFFAAKLYFRNLIHYDLFAFGRSVRICWLIIVFSYSDGTFYLWETNTWTSEPWSSTSGFVTVSTNDTYIIYRWL